MPRTNLALKAGYVEAHKGHPTQEDLARFLRGGLSEEDPYRMFIVRHLLTRCAQCCAVTRRLWGPGPQKRSTPRPRDAARAQLEQDAQEKLLELAERLEGVRDALRGILVGLPPELPDKEEDEVSVTDELRAVIECVINDSIKPAITDLRAAASYPEEPPEEGSGGSR